MSADLGVVVIGRNEGERLQRCLRSVPEGAVRVYVDSASQDGSPERARALGFEVRVLGDEAPFTAARARNAGLEHLLEGHPELGFVQFIDGDCELAEGWVARARPALAQFPDRAVVCGRRREREPEASVYNGLCDIEWDTPIGPADACGGDFLARASALREVGGFAAEMIAGEEPELCLRLRERGWRIERLDEEMTWHSADLERFSQWWRRAARAGHCYAELAWRHGRKADPLGPRAVVSVALYAGLVPLTALGLAPFSGGASLLLLGAHPLLAWRVAGHARRRGRGPRESRAYGAFVTLGKFAEASGVLRFLWSRGRGQASTLMEYKG